LPPDQGTAWAARAPQAEYAVIAGAGHRSNYDQPAQTNDVIRPFLQPNLSG
jgi:pimeloyl-ACP methyl ester carboxylesterase